MKWNTVRSSEGRRVPTAPIGTDPGRRRRRLLAGVVGVVALAVPFAVGQAAVAAPATASAPVRALAEAAPPAAGRLVARTAPSDAVGTIDYTVYLPPGYDAAGSTEYPSLYLLHGRGDTQAAWQQIAPDLDALIADGSIPPLVVVMPDAPWSDRAGYYVDSAYTGTAAQPGAPVETAFTRDLLADVDGSLPTIDDRSARAVGGYSMGGAGALRYVTAHQDLFSQAIVLSPAVYVPTPPKDSSAQEFGAFGAGERLFDEARYEGANYPATFAAFDPASPVHLFIAVGDDEWVNPLPEDRTHDLDYEAATLYNAAKRVAGISAEFRVLDGGHDWDVWRPAFIEGLRDIAVRLQTEPTEPWQGSQTGTPGDDRAGGVLASADGTITQVINAAGDLGEHTGAGGLDIVVERRAADGSPVWTSSIATALNERAYGIVDTGAGTSIIGGYARTDHDAGQNDDALAVGLGADGSERWRTLFGSPSSADRAYAVAGRDDGGAYLAGYTSGVLDGQTSGGDKDAMVASVASDGTVDWAVQFGGSGEDKAYAVAAAPDGGAFVAGGTSGAMPGTTALGGGDGWLARLGADGSVVWVRQLGTAEADQLAAVAVVDGGVVVAGSTRGVLGDASAGDRDAFVARFDEAGNRVWTSQFGSEGDDRAAALQTGTDGGVLVVGHTSGRIAASAGGVDVFTAQLDAGGVVGATGQFGSAARDGADEFDEANLFVAPGVEGTSLVQGLTYGAVAGSANAGAGDVFLSSIAFDGGGPGTEPGTGPGTEPGAGGGAPSGVGGLFGGDGRLQVTGADAGRVAALAALLVSLGAVLVLRRRRAQAFDD
ncbi:alpha/beta hydrolase-fold protein [Plantibacter sp. YIM 135347]|uniref:alpha/beta hydrolase n=1 Tax=Plantibacter sp. YIM 135347 TaxID=3423919 RepID=UPI003D33794B